jgi:putative heme-binding domain-containing protein
MHSAQPGEGSWSALCLDEQGRAIISPQYGPLIRVTMPDENGGRAKVERFHPYLGKAHGLLMVDGDLYANVADSKKGMGGLWRLRDLDGDDRYEDANRLAKYNAGSEHGAHGLALGPDGALWMINGNMTELPTPIATSSPHRNWSEDIVLQRTWDPRGHAVDLMSPGGVVLRTDLEGTTFEIVAAGMRNPYDIAFNADGELFTYDADMEWDIGAPWYRSPRLLHIVSGGEYGWRSGSAKWTIDSPDARPAAAELDAGSPTGVASGHESAFPEPWKSRMFLADWAFGRVLAVDLVPKGASYTAEVHEFLLGRPFNVSDLVFEEDGDLYLVIGGRGSQSGLYRVRWVGDESLQGASSNPNPVAAGLREERRRIEKSHRSLDAIEAEDLLSAVGHGDDAIRYAARIGLERRLLDGESTWFEEALESLSAESGGWELSIAGLRAGDTAHAMSVLANLPFLAEEDDSIDGQRHLARALALLIARHGPLEPMARERVVELVEDRYPTGEYSVDRHMVEILVALDAESVPELTLPLIEQAPSQEEALHYLHVLRLHDEGWSSDTRAKAVAALVRAQQFSGGASLKGFVDASTKGVLARLGPESQTEFDSIMAMAQAEEEVREERPFVRQWTASEIQPHLSRVYAYRNFDRGRQLYEDTQCAKCHKFGDLGSNYGPDLTSVGGRFAPHDLLLTILEPERNLSDQYAALAVTLDDGEVVLGLPVREGDGVLILAPDPRTNATAIEIPLERIRERRETTVMPPALVDTCTMDEILDLLAYLSTGGNSKDPAFRSPP